MQDKAELLRQAKRQVALRRQKAVTRAEQAAEQALAAVSGLAQADAEIRRLGFEAAKLAANGQGKEVWAPALEKVTQARQKRRELLAAHGWSADQLEPAYTCPLCRDTGIYQGKVCRCVLEVCRALRRQEICEASALSLSSFESLDTRWYPDKFDPELGVSVRQYMAEVLESLKDYAEHFDLSSSNLLLVGNAGLGKTHAALAVAGKVLEKGYDVIYTSAETLFSQLEKDRFDEDSTLMEAVQEADLLILDDLGTEYASAYMLSCFYTILNGRLGRGRPTIYTTNIVDGTLFEKRYTEKVASRLGGSCETVEFRGEDVRMLKSRREGTA